MICHHLHATRFDRPAAAGGGSAGGSRTTHMREATSGFRAGATTRRGGRAKATFLEGLVMRSACSAGRVGGGAAAASGSRAGAGSRRLTRARTNSTTSCAVLAAAGAATAAGALGRVGDTLGRSGVQQLRARRRGGGDGEGRAAGCGERVLEGWYWRGCGVRPCGECAGGPRLLRLRKSGPGLGDCRRRYPPSLCARAVAACSACAMLTPGSALRDRPLLRWSDTPKELAAAAARARCVCCGAGFRCSMYGGGTTATAWFALRVACCCCCCCCPACRGACADGASGGLLLRESREDCGVEVRPLNGTGEGDRPPVDACLVRSRTGVVLRSRFASTLGRTGEAGASLRESWR